MSIVSSDIHIQDGEILAETTSASDGWYQFTGLNNGEPSSLPRYIAATTASTLHRR